MVFSPFGLALEGCCPRQVDTRPGLADCLWEKGCPSTTAKTVSSMVQQNPQRVQLDRTMVPVLEDRVTREPATPARLRVLERHALPRAGLRQQMNCL